MNSFSLFKRAAAGVGLVAAAAFATSAAAQPFIDVSSFAGGPGATGSVTVNFTDQTPAATEVIDVRLQFDASVVQNIDLTGCNGNTINGITVQCSNPNPGQVNILVFPFPPVAIGSGTIGTIGFDLAGGAAIGTYPITFIFEEYTGAGGANITPSPSQSTLGDIVVQAPAGAGFYSSNPAPNSTLDLGSAVVNTATAGDLLTVQNLSPDTDFDVTAIGTTAETSVSPAPTQTVPFGGSVDFTFTCTPDTRGPNTGALSVTHTATAGATSPVPYDYTCAGLAPNVNVAGPTPNPMTALTVDPAPTADISVTNPQDGFTSAANNVNITAGAGSPEITVALGGPITVNPDASTTFTIECDNTAAGNFSRDFDITWDDPETGGTATQTVTANCDITNAVATFSGTPASPGPLNFGTVTNGTTATIGIDVANSGVGPTPDSDLMIISASTSDPQFGFTINNDGPFLVGQPATPDAIDVTCTPDAGTTGAFTGTLTINHDGSNNPTTYDLNCAGTSDATFSSTPADGGNLNLGIVPPATMTPPGNLVFSNGGSVDSYDIACTVTDPDGVFTFTPSPISFTVAPGASEPVQFQCTPAAPQIYQADVACTITGADVATANYTVTCAGQPLVVPTMNRWGLILMALALLALGGFAGRRMMA